METYHQGVLTNPLIVRLKRYVKEIKESVEKVTNEEFAAESVLADVPFSTVMQKELNLPTLVHAEKHIEPSGLYRKLLLLSEKVSELERIRDQLNDKAKGAEIVPTLRANLESLSKEKECLAEQLESIKKASAETERKQIERFDELHRVFEELTEQSDKNILLCEKRRIQIESLEAERDSLKQALATMETHYKETIDNLKNIQDVDASKLEETTQLLLMERENHKAQQSQLLAHWTQAKEKDDAAAQSSMKELQEKVDLLTENYKQSQITIEHLRKQADSHYHKSVNEEELKQYKQRVSLLEGKTRELESQLTAARTELIVSQTNVKKLKSKQISRNELQSKLKRWEEAASILSLEEAGVLMTSYQLEEFLVSIATWKRQLLEEVEKHLKSESELLLEINSVRDELKLITLNNYEQKERCQIAETQTNIANSALKSLRDLIERTHKQDDGSPFQSNDDKYLKQIYDTVEAFDIEKQKLQKVISEAQELSIQFSQEKQAQLEKLQRATLNFSHLETLYATLSMEHKQARLLLEEQNKTLKHAQDKIKTLEQSPSHERLELFKKEREDALNLVEVTRDFYRNEAIVLRAIIRALFGWQISIDMAPVDQNITIVLRPGLDYNYSEHDDGAFVFKVKSKSPPIPLKDLPQTAIEQEINKLYMDEDFDLHLDGRYAEKWETDENWKNQLSARCSYAAFLAVTILGEQNQLLQRNAFLNSSKHRKLQQSPPEI